MVQAALVPISIGLMRRGNPGADRHRSRTITVIAAPLAATTGLDPLWLLVAAGCLGFAGVV
jgi:chromate transporter